MAGRWLAFAACAFLVFPLAFACGDDDSTQPDRQYVSAICRVMQANDQRVSDLGLNDQTPTEDAIHKLAPLTATLAKDLGAVKPAAGMEEFQSQFVKELETTSTRMTSWKEGDGDVFLTLEQMKPPPNVSARLDAVAAGDPICQQAGFTFSEGFGGAEG
jgi:hypothetical protein